MDAREQRLQVLADATKLWAEKRTKELNDNVATAKKILKGRTGSERLASATAKAATDLVLDEIDSFFLAP